MSSSAKSVRFFPSLTGSASDTGFLSKIKNMATSMSWKTILIVVCAIILIIIAYSFFKQQIKITLMKTLLVLHHRSFFHHMEIRVGTSVNLSPFPCNHATVVAWTVV